MSATVLGLEMLLHESSIDLRMASDLVLSDIGATIHILRLIGNEYDASLDRPNRMGDCLASLDVDDWFDAIAAHSFSTDERHMPMTAVWQHCRLVAQCAQVVAESVEHVAPEDAYLVGLLHGVGAIPTVLGWHPGMVGSRGQEASLALEGILPLFVLVALRSVDDPSSSSPWRSILAKAHEMAYSNMGHSPLPHTDVSAWGECASTRQIVPGFGHCGLHSCQSGD